MTFIADLQALVECESPSEDLLACRRVIELAAEIAQQRLNISASILEVEGRPVFWWGSKNPKVVLLAHLDTVWPIGSFQPLWSVDGDVARGPGIFDMKTGFLQGLYSLIDFPGALTHVALIATSDEEVGSQKSRALIQEVAAHADAVLVLEAAFEGMVKTGRKGTSMYQIQVHGRAAHAGLEPEKGINATIEIAKVVEQVSLLADEKFGTTVVPTTMNSGTTTNTVPALASLDIDVRSFSGAELTRVDAEIRQLAPMHTDAKIEIAGGINRPPLELKSTFELYEKLESVAKDLGMPIIGHASVGGASDGNFAAAAGAKTLDGLGAVGFGAHAPTEHVLLSSVQSRITLLTAFIKELLRD
jgi:glutamate carboxypeptidase